MGRHRPSSPHPPETNALLIAVLKKGDNNRGPFGCLAPKACISVRARRPENTKVKLNQSKFSRGTSPQGRQSRRKCRVFSYFFRREHFHCPTTQSWWFVQGSHHAVSSFRWALHRSVSTSKLCTSLSRGLQHLAVSRMSPCRAM